MMKKSNKILWSLGLSLSLLLVNPVFASSSTPSQQQANPQANPSVQASLPKQTAQSQKVNFSPIFISISDAMSLVKDGQMSQASHELQKSRKAFDALDIDGQHHTLRQSVLSAFQTALQSPTDEYLGNLSTALYTLEKAQNPVDYTQANERFAQKVTPALDDLAKAIERFRGDGDVDNLRLAYDAFNRIWVANERVVRNTQKGHYGAIETAMALLRVAIETQNLAQMDSQFVTLKEAIDGYVLGKPMRVQADESIDLAYGIRLLQGGLDDLQAGRVADAQGKLGQFIQSWVVFEGEVSTRNPALYTQIESQIPIIMAKGDTASQEKLTNIIKELQAINPAARYTSLDSMLILLREGLEALLIVVALITALNASGQRAAKKWIYAGVSLGMAGSVLGAVALYSLFPQLTGGANREALEGVVGIVAVAMMIGVGAWLHSKSSTRAWNAYIKQNLGKAMSTGSFISLFLLAFLSVFREGAETILFYVGILPNIAMKDFVLGIGLALLILAIVAVILLKTSVKLPIPMLFKILTSTIYVLGFKILGVSILALQLTNHLPRTIIDLPSVEWLGFYPSVQGVFGQVVYLLVIILMMFFQKNRQH